MTHRDYYDYPLPPILMLLERAGGMIPQGRRGGGRPLMLVLGVVARPASAGEVGVWW